MASAWRLADVTAAGFTAVVGAAVLMPVCGAQRHAAHRAQCNQNLNTLADAVSDYASDWRYYPPSYVYGSATTGIGWKLSDQQSANPNPSNGYVHWSGIFLSLGYVAQTQTFQCVDALRGGAPNTNPGPVAADWEPGQVNEIGQTTPASVPSDRQAKRLAYTANAVFMPRNKFNGSVPRRAQLVALKNRNGPSQDDGVSTDHQLVQPHADATPQTTILLTEWLFSPFYGWFTLGDWHNTVYTHRPVTPFRGVTSGTDVFSEPTGGNQPRFRYPSASELLPTSSLGWGVLLDSPSELNAVGRHRAGETALFARLDGSVIQSTVQNTVARRWWGEKFHSISGNNHVAN